MREGEGRATGKKAWWGGNGSKDQNLCFNSVDFNKAVALFIPSFFTLKNVRFFLKSKSLIGEQGKRIQQGA